MKNFYLCSILFCFFLINCDKTSIVEISDNPDPIVNIAEEEKIFITDATGKKWDVTHAANKYNMQPEKFQYGLGPFAIRPILTPKFTSPEEENWPENGDFLVIATRMNNDARAYPIYIMKSFEIANEVFGDTLVAAAY